MNVRGACPAKPRRGDLFIVRESLEDPSPSGAACSALNSGLVGCPGTALQAEHAAPLGLKTASTADSPIKLSPLRDWLTQLSHFSTERAKPFADQTNSATAPAEPGFS